MFRKEWISYDASGNLTLYKKKKIKCTYLEFISAFNTVETVLEK